ncbi:MAG: cupredoxin domain-containing protein, partial [Actinobacteria bacterium]|nr:cupredoxin domain-containing protein [Actinomycetota bacterium]
RRFALALLPLLLALPVAVAACGGGENGGANDAAADEPLETIDISATEFAFEPAEIELDSAGTYRFVLTNDGGAPHALEIEGNGVEAGTDTIDGGESAQVDVTLDEGEYEIYCPVGDHAERGMVGRVLVGGGASGGGATTDDSEDETTTAETDTQEGETEPESDFDY